MYMRAEVVIIFIGKLDRLSEGVILRACGSFEILSKITFIYIAAEQEIISICAHLKASTRVPNL